MPVIQPAALIDCHKDVLVEMYGVIVWGGLVTVGKSFEAEDPPWPASEVVLPRHSRESPDKRLGTNSTRRAYLLGIFGSALNCLRHDAQAR